MHNRALAKGAQAFLQRPMSPQNLLAEVKTLIEKSRAGHGQHWPKDFRQGGP